MSVPPLRPSYDFDSYISGEVIIHPSAVLAPGVILQAAPNSKIIIGSGVCIGMGSILQVHEGILEVQAGANLGAGFLMVGKGKIGANACIGAATTIFNCSVEPGQVVAGGSVLGDLSRRVSESPTQTEQTTQSKSSTTDPTFSGTESNNGTARQQGRQRNKETNRQEDKEELTSKSSPPPDIPTSSPSPSVSNQDSQISTHIYGQKSIQKLLVTLFPHKQSLNEPISDDGQPE
ncbi:transferase [Brasilonema sp. UFV-L1]|uniref:transferase n=1 Tax=Brasilonema sp. UFV-L1 TaxID=2234130 RepID=UPI00145DFD36|nr:transferase [Brasilonema sp. UFV-L1]NMG10957.1 transferase [Brasilonema sp. UFV-L1]